MCGILNLYMLHLYQSDPGLEEKGINASWLSI